MHAVLSEKELERQYGTLEALLDAEELRPWIDWIRRRKPGGRLPTRMSRRRRRGS